MPQEHRQRHKPGEPKHARQRIQGQDGVLVGEAREVDGAEGEVDGYEEGPEGDEDEEVDLGGGVGGGTGVVPGCDCSRERVS